MSMRSQGNSIHDWMTARIAAFGLCAKASLAGFGLSLRRASGSHPACLLGEGAVPDAEEAVFDLPVVPGQRQQSSLIRHSGWIDVMA